MSFHLKTEKNHLILKICFLCYFVPWKHGPGSISPIFPTVARYVLQRVFLKDNINYSKDDVAYKNIKWKAETERRERFWIIYVFSNLSVRNIRVRKSFSYELTKSQWQKIESSQFCGNIFIERGLKYDISVRNIFVCLLYYIQFKNLLRFGFS